MVLLAIIWIMLPLVLIPVNIVLAVKYNNLKNKTENNIINNNYCQRDNSIDIKPPEISEHIVFRERKVNTVNPLNIILITGVIFIVMAGVIFSVANWNSMNSAFKTFIIFSASVIFYIVGFISEKKLKLKKTSVSFFTMGSIFLPIGIVAAGYLRLFGEWLSFEGNGRNIILMTAFIVFTITSGVNSVKYSSQLFAAVSLGATSFAGIFMIHGLIYDYNLSYLYPLCYALYSFAVIFTSRNAQYHHMFRPFQKIMDKFVVINTYLFSGLSLVNISDSTKVYALSLMAFSLMFFE